MAKSTTAQRSAHVILALVAIALPTLSLLPLGGLYLWEKGYLLMWALSALVCIGLVYALQWTMLRKAKARSAVIEPAARGANTYTGKEKQRGSMSAPSRQRSIPRRSIRAKPRSISPSAPSGPWPKPCIQNTAIRSGISRFPKRSPSQNASAGGSARSSSTPFPSAIA